MGHSLETSVILPGVLILLLLFLLFAPVIWARTDQLAREGIREAHSWTKDSRIYEERPRANLITQPERLAQVLDLVEDLMRRGGKEAS